MRILLSILFLGVLISSCNGRENPDLAARKQLAAAVDSVSKPHQDTLHFAVDGKQCLAVIDGRYKEFKHKGEFPLSLFISITTLKKDINGHPEAQEVRIHTEMMTEILEKLNSATVNAYIGKTTMNGFEDMIFYIKNEDEKKVSNILIDLKKKHTRIKEFTFEKDPQWEAVSEFYEALKEGVIRKEN
ncbi:MAG TPA: DUF695 domain-containing protein [Sphingobacteriaceae bacterium]